MIPEKRIDKALKRVLKAAGLRLKDCDPKRLDDMREAMRKVMSESYIQGSNDLHQVISRGGQP